MSLPVVHPKTAFCILNSRSKLDMSGADILVNVYGKVICVSEVVKIKDSLLFMVKFMPNVDVIIKRKDCLHWQEQLSPHREYVFTDLRPTSFQKGSRSAQRVFTVTKSSKLLLPDGMELKLITTSDWLKQHGLQDTMDTECDVNIQDTVIDNLFSYQGKVTAILDQGLGVFEVDNTVRLHVGPLPAAHKFSMLKKGSTVLVQNAHFTTSKQYPRLCLYCCMLTSVKCLDNPVDKVISVQLSQNLKKLLYLEGQSQGHLDLMFGIRQVLKKQFLDGFGERHTEKIFSTVIGHRELNGSISNLQSIPREPRRILIDEFLNIPHNCCLAKEANKVNVSFRTVAEVKESISDISSEMMEWQYVRQLPREQQVILGVLKLDEITGNLLLHEDTGSIEVVTCCYHGDREVKTECDHICRGTCNCDKIDIGDKFPCPYVHTCCVSKIVALTVYEMVCETMVTKNISYLKDKNKRSRSDCEKYILLDMRNVIYVGNSIQPLKNDTNCLNIEVTSNACSESIVGMCVNLEIKQNCGKNSDSPQNLAEMCSKRDSLNTEMVNCDTDCRKVMQAFTRKSKVVGEKDKTGQRTSALHRHVKEDGTIVFCRKVDCLEKEDPGEKRDSCKETGFDKLAKKTNSFEISQAEEKGKEEEEDAALVESTNLRVFPLDLGKTAFKVKPVSHRKRVGLGMQGMAADNSGLPKRAKTDLTKARDAGKETTTDGIANMLESKVDDEEHFDFDSLCDSTKDVIVYVESKGSLMSEGEGLRFSVECTVFRKKDQEQVIIECNGKSVKWYPVLYPSAYYKLSMSTEGGAVLEGSGNDKLKKMLQRSKTRRCLTVGEKVHLSRIWNLSMQSCGLMPATLMSLQDVLKQDFTEKFVSFEGWILNRTLVKPGFASKSFSKDIGANGMYSRMHVQDASRKEDIWVYLNDNTVISEKGLVPGSRVKFFGLERKLSQLNNIYCRLVPLSSVQLLCVETERNIKMQKVGRTREDEDKQLPVLHLMDIWSPSNASRAFQCICDIEKILKVSLKCLCETCGSMIFGGACTNSACNGGGSRFLARASAIVDDSTSVAMVTMTGSSVQSLLQLSHDQWKCLEEEVSQTGELFVQQFNPSLSTSLESFVYKLCDNHAVKQTWLMTLKTRSYLDINKIAHDEFCLKSFDTGSSRISTQCLPFLQLECLALKVFEPSFWSVCHLRDK